MISCTYATLLLLHLHVLCCLALASSPSPSALALAQPPQHPDTRCPTTCKKLHIEYPFGAVPGCGAPGFQLDCNASGDHPAWILPGRADLRQYVVVDILKNEHANGSFVVRDAGMSSCTDVHPAANLAHLQLSLASLTFAEFHVPNGVDVLVFNCSVKLTRPPTNALGGRFNYSPPACKDFLQKCGQNLSRYMKPTCFLTHSIDEDFSLLTSMYSCSSYASFYNVPSPLPASFPAGIQDGAQLQWSNPLNANACQKCMRSNGECGYVADDDRNFRCLCSGGKFSPTTCPGCSGHHCRYKKVLAIALPVIAFVGIVVASISCVIWHRKKRMLVGKNLFYLSNNSNKDLVQILADQMGSLPTKLFTYKELDHATDSFSNSRMIGDGGCGTVYEGRLYDGRKIAVKRLYHDNFRRLEQFFNEIRILSSLQHPNLIKLYGFCYEEQRDLLLVYEYMSNGTLADHLHGEEGTWLSWETRLNIAVETAKALAYLHSCVKPPIFHRDVKSSNILLDENFHVKVADFGLSRLVPLEATHISTAPQGTPGYIDPDYHECYQLTDKSDVYSFGVVLMEIISSKRAVDVSRGRKEINLSNLAVSKIQGGSLEELVDPRLEIARNTAIKQMVTGVAGLGLQCLALERDDRPSMKEAADELEKMRNVGYGLGNDQEKLENRISSFDSNNTSKLLKPGIRLSPTSVHEMLSSSSTS